MRRISRYSAAACLAVGAGQACAQLPPGFIRTHLSDQVSSVTAIAVLPDLRVICSDQAGYVTLVTPGSPPTTTLILQLTDAWAFDDHGVLGVAADPSFATNGYFYLYYTATGPYNLIARYTLAGGTVNPASRTVIWQNPDLCPGESHHGGSMNFGPDGNLYVTTGDQYTVPANAQNLTNLHGKVLRLAPDGSVPPDNPYVGVPGVQPAIWATGLRNPFRATIDALTGTLYVGDVGSSEREEIDRVSIGANMGWPDMEGTTCSVSSCAAYTAPIFDYWHGDTQYAAGYSAAVICGPVYRGTAFPPEYRGNLFFADWVNGWMRRMVFDANGAVTSIQVFDPSPDVTTITDIKVGPDGALYYGIFSPNPGTPIGLFKISATTGGNQPPIVVAGGTPTSANNAPLTVQFNSTGTNDPDNGPQPLSYLWTFGDGQTSALPAPSHPYTARGSYNARLTVTDGLDSVSSPDIPITVGHLPVPTISTPAPQLPYRAGDIISFSGSATDSEDGNLPASAFTWNVMLVHLTHTHPESGPIPGVTSGSFDIPTSGHDPENTHYRLDLTVRDSDNMVSTTSVHLAPVSSPITINTVPSGIPVFLDGRALATPRLYQSLVGFHHQLAAQPTFVMNGAMYTFTNWSNAQPATFNFVSPEGGLSLTANYTFCYANCDQSTQAPILNVADFTCFLQRYAAGDSYANCDQSTQPPTINVVDFTCFLQKFAAGCP